MKSIKYIAIVLFLSLLVSCAQQNIDNKNESSTSINTFATSSVTDTPTSTTSSAAETSSVIDIPISTTSSATVTSNVINIPTSTTSSTSLTSKVDDILSPFVKTKNIGSCKELRGRCLFINIFLSDEESTFTDEEKQSAIDKFDQAINYINNQANLYGVQLTIQHNQNDLEINYKANFIIPTDLSAHRWGDDLITKIKSDFNVEQLVKKYDAKNVGFIFNINKCATSKALQQQYGYSSSFDNEACIIYSSTPDIENAATQTAPFVYAHEMFHLFGAIDLYYPFSPNDERISLAESFFPNDIMRVYTYDLNTATMSDVDTYLIGWREKLKKDDVIFVNEPFDS